MANDHAAFMGGEYVRITRLNEDGTLKVGEENSYVTRGFISVGMTPEYEDGEEITQKNAAGEVCLSYKTPDTLKRISLEVAICEPDPELTELATGGVLLSSGDDAVGWASPQVGIDALPNGVAVEVWQKAIVNGKPSGTNPYVHWIFPYAVLRLGGDRQIEAGRLATSFEGWAVGNVGFGDGPATPFWPFPTYSDRPYAYARTASVPAGTGFQAVAADVP